MRAFVLRVGSATGHARKTAMRWVACGWVIWGATVAWADEPPKPADDAAIQRALANLDNADWAVREQATRQLAKFGSSAVHTLAQCARNGSPEASIRAIDVLSEVYELGSPSDAEALDDEFEPLTTMKGSVGEAARSVWEEHRPGRERRAIAQIERLGGRVDFGPEPRIDFDEDTTPDVDYVVIGPRWTGGDSGLKYVLRLSEVFRKREIKRVYRVKGAPITENGVQLLADAHFQVDDRGAYLGIASKSFGGFDIEGCSIDEVRPESPADKAGLLPRDRILKFDDHEVKDFTELIDLLKAGEPGQHVTFTVLRAGEAVRVPVELGSW